MKINLFFCLFSLSLLSPDLAAQDLLDLNTARYCQYGKGVPDEELYRFSGDAATIEQIRQIALEGGVEAGVQSIQTNVETVAMVLDSGQYFLLYSLDFLQKADPIERLGALAHEIGHLANQHGLHAGQRQTEEEEADRFMGYLLGKNGFPWSDVEVFLKKIPGTLPLETRLQVVRAGFTKAGQVLQLNSLPFDDTGLQSPQTLPQFPWPPPSCNARLELPEAAFAGLKTLGDADRKLRLALDTRGYAQRSYFSVPNGFALVTQLEQYQSADASIRNDRTRWLDYPVQDNFSSLLDYLKAFVVPQKGYFRLFVFVVTNRSFGGASQRVSKEQASAWLGQGFNKLPPVLAAAPFAETYAVTALVYEFEVPESNRKPVQKCPSPRFSAKTHLRKSGIAPALGF